MPAGRVAPFVLKVPIDANLEYAWGTGHVIRGCDDVLRNTCWLLGANLVLSTSKGLLPASRYLRTIVGMTKREEDTATTISEQLEMRDAVHSAGPLQKLFCQ